MPLVFVVVAIIVALVVAKDSGKESRRVKANEIASYRRTNTSLEAKLVRKYAATMPLEQAYELGREELKACGFDPCIPMSDFENAVPTYDRHESSLIRSARSDLILLSNYSNHHYEYKDGDEYINIPPHPSSSDWFMYENWVYKHLLPHGGIGKQLIWRGTLYTIHDIIVNIPEYSVDYILRNEYEGCDESFASFELSDKKITWL